MDNAVPAIPTEIEIRSEKSSHLLRVEGVEDGKPYFVLLRVSLDRSNNMTRGKDVFKIDVRFLDTDALHLRGNLRTSVMQAKGEASTTFRMVSFSDGFVVVEPDELRGLHIGTYVFNHLVAWAKETYPDYRVCLISLLVPQARQPGDRDRRNRFYERFGFRFFYNDAEKRSGASDLELRAGELSTVDSWTRNISLVDETDYLRDLAHRLRMSEGEKAAANANVNYLSMVVASYRKHMDEQSSRKGMFVATGMFVLGVWVCSSFPWIGRIFGH